MTYYFEGVFVVVLGKYKSLLTATIAMAAYLVAGQAMAVIVSPSIPLAHQNTDQLLQSCLEQMLASDTLASDGCAFIPEDQDGPLRIQVNVPAEGGGCTDPASTSSTSSSSVVMVIQSAVAYLWGGLLQTGLPREEGLILPTGPPFQLLRPA